MTSEDELILAECCKFLGEDRAKLALSPIVEETLIDWWRSIRPRVCQMRQLIEAHRKDQ